jgi:hypothetical protein
LYFTNTHPAFSRLYNQFPSLMTGDSSRNPLLPRAVHNTGRKKLDLSTLKNGVSPWFWIQSANQGRDTHGTLIPVNPAKALLNFRGIGGTSIILGLFRDRIPSHLLKGPDHEIAGSLGQPVVQMPCCFILENGHLFLKQNGTCVQAFIHSHDGEARFRLIVEDSPLDGRRPPVPGQEGGMGIDDAPLWDVQKSFFQNLAKGDDNDEIRLSPLHKLAESLLGSFLRLKYFDPIFLGKSLNR